MDTPVLYVVVPCYNEEEVLPISSRTLFMIIRDLVIRGEISSDSRVLFVDDGSKDSTWKIICGLFEQWPYVEGIKLAHNAGHQKALLAGLRGARGKCDCVITIDADLQDDPSVMRDFVNAYKKGADVVYGVRRSRDRDTFFKKTTAHVYYKLMKFLGVDLVYDHADYRLLSSEALDALLKYRESNPFLRGIVPQLGFKTAKVYYDRAERVAGESKYPLKKMLAFAWNGITSFTDKPLKLSMIFAFICFIVSILSLIFGGNQSFGLFSVWFVGFMLMMCLSLIGEYVGMTYLESKRRPKYIIEDYLQDFGDNTKDSLDVSDGVE